MTDLEMRIKDRLENGFKNWNGGYEMWENWCNTLYEPDALYNIDGRHLTLKEYKDMMKKYLGVYDVQLGQFYNMLIIDNWCAIRYTTVKTDRKTGEKTEHMAMEFVNFKDNPEPIGVRVVEGWALGEKPVE